MSLRKPLWNDEIYTQERVIEVVSYVQILSGHFPEGNNGPLFYLIQKAFCDLQHFHFPLKWKQEWLLSEPRSQVVLRIPSNVLMSLTLTLIFYFFARQYSLAVGVYSFLIGISSPMIWEYWVEARPYTLWVFLTTCQALLVLNIFQEKQMAPTHWRWLNLVHLGLATTTVVSLAQIVVVSSIIWFYKERDWKKYWWATIFPVTVGVYYLLQAPIVGYGLHACWPLVLSNMPPERLGILLIYGLFLVWLAKTRSSSSGETRRQEGLAFLVIVVLLLAAAFAQMVVIYLKATGPWAQMQVPDRVFIHLTPLGIIATSLFSVELFRYFKHDGWMRTNLIVGLGGLIVVRLLQTALVVVSLNIY